MQSSDYSLVGLATATPSVLHRSLVALFACMLVLLTVVLWPRAGDAGPALPMFVGAYQTAVAICDLITALLLFSQFAQYRSANLLILSCGYLFTSIIVTVHLSSFPGVFATDGIIGGNASTAPWLWTIWHSIFPATVLLYAVVRHPVDASPTRAIAVAVILTVGAVTAAYVFSTHYNDVLPPMIVERTFTPFFLNFIYPVLMALCIAALAALLFRPAQHPIITLYLLLAVLAFFLDVVNNWHSGARYALGWYLGRANSLVASVSLCIVFVIESAVLLRYANRAAADQELAKNQLGRERDFAEGLVDTAPAIVLVLDPQGRIVRFNPYFEKLSGYSLNEAQGKDWFSGFLPAAIADSTREVFQKTVHDIPTSGHINSIVTRNGEKRLIEWYNKTLKNNADTIGVLAVGIDITERKQAEDALRESEANLSAMLDNLPYLTWLKDSGGRYIKINKVFADYLHLENPQQAIGKTDLDLQPKELAEKYRADDAEVMAAKKSKHVEESAFDGKNTHWVETYKTPIIDPHGNVLGTAGFASDITERKRVEQSLRDADQRKDEFLAMLAHELRNPLVPIRNAAHIIGRLGLDEPRIEWSLELINRQVNHLTRLVDDLLDVSRIAQGKINLNLGEIELAALVGQLMQSIRPLAESKRHQLAVRLPNQPVWLQGDTVRLSQMLFNLMDNAIKYTPDGGQIEFAARLVGQEIKISVRDNGMGIRAELLPRVFDLFQQDERKLDRAQGGLGIGLTLVQRLVRMHGGRVAAYSEGHGLGATFTVWLPVMSAPPAVHDEAAKSSTTSGVRVLVVDDEHRVSESTATLLELEGHTVRIADSGLAALEQIPGFRPQVVLLDIGLKGMDGFETAKRLRELPGGRDLFLVAVTGYGDEKTRMQAMASGCDHFVVKPVTFDILRDLLAKAVGMDGVRNFM